MRSAKEEVRKLLDALPEDASFEQIQYHIYVRQQAAEEGRVLSQEEAERRMERWLGS